MLKLLFCAAAILPIAIIPWMTTEVENMDGLAPSSSYAELVTDPNIEALADCHEAELPIYFTESYITSHSAEFIIDGFDAVEFCDEIDVTIVPVLPQDPHSSELAHSVVRTSELSAYVEDAARISNLTVTVTVSSKPLHEETSTLYINGRAAILRIDPKTRAG